MSQPNTLHEQPIEKVVSSAFENPPEYVVETFDQNINDVLLSCERMLHDLTQQFSVVSSTNSAFDFSGLVNALIAAGVGAFSAYAFNHLHWSMVHKKEKVCNVCHILHEMIVELEKTSIRYWLSPYEASKLTEFHAEEIKIKSLIFLINRHIRMLNKQLSKLKEQVSLGEVLEEFSDDVFDLVTGDEFESINRRTSKTKANKISKECIKARSELLLFNSSM